MDEALPQLYDSLEIDSDFFLKFLDKAINKDSSIVCLETDDEYKNQVQKKEDEDGKIEDQNQVLEDFLMEDTSPAKLQKR